jgi:acylpyruvate hydrolase
MRIVHFEKGGVPGIAADDGSGWHGLTKRESDFPGTLPELIAQGADLLRRGKALLPMQAIDLNSVRVLPPVPKPPKILCVGLNYDDHLVSARQELAMPPETTLDQAYHFGMFMMKAVLDGRASQLIDLARVNLTR